MIAEIPNENLGGRRGHDYRNASKRRTSILVGVGLSVLIHAIGLWLVIERAPLTVKMTASEAEGRMTVSLAPPVTHPPAQQNKPESVVPAPKKTAPQHPAIKKRIRKRAIERVPDNVSKPVPKATQPDTAPRKLAPPDDMFTQLEAARKRRADAQAQANVPEPQTEPSTRNDNSVALANIARSLNYARGADKVNTGGVFEIRRIGYRDAEVVFRGWSASSRRNSMRLITVEQGADVDIQTAIVKKIIDVIREEKTGDFLWDSHRLGKTISLSARVQDSAELQRFLMREFFPDYLPPASGK